MSVHASSKFPSGSSGGLKSVTLNTYVPASNPERLTADPVPGGITNPGVTAVIARLPEPPIANKSKAASLAPKQSRV